MIRKKILVAITALTISMASIAEDINDIVAPRINVLVGLDLRTMGSNFTEFDTNHTAGSIAFEHYIPMVPNLKFKTAFLNADSDGNSATNTILYYRLYYLGPIEVDGGAAYTDIKTASEETSILQAYVTGRFFIPDSDLNVYGELTQGSLMTDSASQIGLGIAYRFVHPNLLLNMAARAGYYSQTVSFDNAPSDRISEGLFIGVDVLF